MNALQFQDLQKVAEIGDRFISYVDQGQGDPVVLIHGIPTWGYLWSNLLPELAKAYRVLIPDLLGFGYSDKSDRFDRSIAKQAEAIELWLDRLGVQSAAIVGHDIGGGVALRLAAHFPARVRRLCILNSVCYDSWPIELMLQFGHPGVNRLLSARTATMVLKRALRAGFHKSPPKSFLDELLRPYSTEVGKLSLIRNASALNTNLTTELNSLLPKLQMPTRIIWGEDDRFQAAEYGRRLAWDLPHASYVPIRHARHFVMIDQPQNVLQSLNDFFKATTQAKTSAA